MRTTTQTALVPGRPDYAQAECLTKDCALYTVTLRLGEHEKLTPEAIAKYAAVNAELRRFSSR